MAKLFTVGSLVLLMSFSANAQSGSVLFRVTGINTDLGGALSSGIFKASDFPMVGKQYRGKDLKVESTDMEVLLEDVPVGTYGAVVFQDANSKQDLDTNLIGFPKEPIGFANHAKIRLGPPSFEDAAIVVRPDETVIVAIELK